MWTRPVILCVAAVFAAAMLFQTADAAQTIIPAYFYPGSTWDSFTNAPANSKTYAIIFNPNNGPGSAVDASYRTYVNRAKAAGVRALGYVATTWGARAISAVKADIDRHYSWYGVDGIFFDEGAVSSTKVSYYQQLYNYVKAKSATKNFVMINPGTYYQTSAYIPYGDSHMVWENAYSAYTSFSMPSWVRNYPASKFTHVIHSTPSSKMSNAVALAKQRNVGYIFVTDDIMGNPYDRMPAYWSSLVSVL
jgi:hypothetical protein